MFCCMLIVQVTPKYHLANILLYYVFFLHMFVLLVFR